MSQFSELLIKGYRSGVLITFPPLSSTAQREMLIRRIQSQERFFKGGRIILDVGETVWDEREIGKLLRDLSDEGICLWAILSTASETITAAASFDIPTSINPEGTAPVTDPQASRDPDITWLEKDIPEGETLIFHGKVCMIGDVKNSACLKADGSVVLWGKAAGEIRAGEKPCPKNSIHIFDYQGATCYLNGKLIHFPNKLKSGSSLHIWQEGESIKVEAWKAKRFGF